MNVNIFEYNIMCIPLTFMGSCCNKPYKASGKGRICVYFEGISVAMYVMIIILAFTLQKRQTQIEEMIESVSIYDSTFLTLQVGLRVKILLQIPLHA